MDVGNPGNDGWDKYGNPVVVDDNRVEHESYHGPTILEAVENQLAEQGFRKQNDAGALLNYWAASMPAQRNDPSNPNYMWAVDALSVEFARVNSTGIDISTLSLADIDEFYREVYNKRAGMIIGIAGDGTLIAPLARSISKFQALVQKTSSPPSLPNEEFGNANMTTRRNRIAIYLAYLAKILDNLSGQ